MNVESVVPILLILAPFAIAYLIEALVIYFFRLKGIFASIGISVLINLLSLALIYFIGAPLLGKLGYELGQFNGLNLEIQVVAFICWFSIIVEALLLQLFIRSQQKKQVFIASIVMNILSYLFLNLFILYSH
jgi:hypothetical protein